MRLVSFIAAIALSLILVVMSSSCGGGGTASAPPHFGPDAPIAKLDLNNPLDRWAYNPAASANHSVSHVVFTQQELMAGQTIDVGYVKVWADGETLFVKYAVDADPWWLDAVHFNIGTGAPTKDDFDPGRMPYAAGPFTAPTAPFTGDGIWYGTEYTFAIDLSDAGLTCGTEYWFITHAVVKKYTVYNELTGQWVTNSQTGYAGDHNSRDDGITKKWGFYFHWTIYCHKWIEMPTAKYQVWGLNPGYGLGYGYWHLRFNGTWGTTDDPICPPIPPDDPLGWLGWCVATGITWNGTPQWSPPGEVYLYDTTSPTFPWQYTNDAAPLLRDWDKINWLINQKRIDMGAGSAIAPFDTIGGTSQPAYDSYMVRSAFQRAYWHFVKEPNALTGTGFVYIDNSSTCLILAQNLVSAANSLGVGFNPHVGDWFAVLLFDADPNTLPNNYKVPTFQPNIMEVDP